MSILRQTYLGSGLYWKLGSIEFNSYMYSTINVFVLVF